MEKPRINLVYFKSILDRCLLRFFSERNSEFSKTDDGYVFSGQAGEQELVGIFTKYVKEELGKYVTDSEMDFFFVIGSCCPGENVLLNHLEPGNKLKRLIDSNPDIRYFLVEDDIRLDMRLFNSVFERIFVKFMSEKRKTWKNVFFVRHRNLDCYFLYKLFKRHFGSMVVNLHKKEEMGADRCIYSVNEELDSRCRNKLEILRGNDVIEIYREVFRYIDICLNEVF